MATKLRVTVSTRTTYADSLALPRTMLIIVDTDVKYTQLLFLRFKQSGFLHHLYPMV